MKEGRKGRKQGKREGGKRLGGERINVQSPFKKVQKGTSSVVQWLRLHIFYCRGHRFDSKIPYAMEYGKKCAKYVVLADTQNELISKLNSALRFQNLWQKIMK